MDQLGDLRPDGPPPRMSSASQGGMGWVLVLLLVLVAGGVAVWRYFERQRSMPPGALAAAPPVAAPEVPPLPDPAPVDPAAGDALLKELLTSFSSSADLAAWVARGLIRPIAAATNLVADGDSPAQVLPFLAPNKGFKVQRVKRQLFIDPKGYARYNRVTRVIASIDAVAAAAAYQKLKPFFEAAYAEVGRPNRTFDDVIRAAITRLVDVWIPKGRVKLERKGLVYAFADPELESRSAAEKHLLRMGPKNMATIQAKLRELQAALDASGAAPAAPSPPTATPTPSPPPPGPAGALYEPSEVR